MSQTSVAGGPSGPRSDLFVRFPAADFISMAEFELFCRENSLLLEARYAHERRIASDAHERRIASDAHEGRIASDAQGLLVREGTCAPCLRVARFTSRIAPGESVPNWREGQTCDCGDTLGNRSRAALHFLESVAGLSEWSRVLLFGPPDILDRRLAAGRPGFARQGRLTRMGGTHRLDVADGSCHAVVSWDHMHHVPPLGTLLAEVRRALAPGGSFVFTVPFRYRSAVTVSHLDGTLGPDGVMLAEMEHEVHELGWDLLDRLREAGFVRCRAHVYWSEELGYLGPYNMLFSASI